MKTPALWASPRPGALRCIKMAKAILLASALACSASVANAVEELQGSEAVLSFVDLTEEFDQAWRACGAKADAATTGACFREHMRATAPGFYSHERRNMTSAQYDELVVRELGQYGRNRAALRRQSRESAAQFRQALAQFEEVFGRMRGYPPAYLLHSLGEFDGGIRDVDGGPHLLFGGDVMARVHSPGTIGSFFHHELFHLYHLRSLDGCEAVWCQLWAEGLAVYAASVLNPQTTDEGLLLTKPEPLRAPVEAARDEAFCAVFVRFDSKDPEAFKALFDGSTRISPNLPPRFGYYVGYVLAAELGRASTPQTLAHMKLEEVRAALSSVLTKSNSCVAVP